MQETPPAPSLACRDELQDRIGNILALCDLLGCIGTCYDPARLHPRTVSRMGFLIERETEGIASLLGNTPRASTRVSHQVEE